MLKNYLFGAAAGALALAIYSPAHAQTATPQSPAPAETAQDQADTGQTEEIIVTAERREQRLQETPATVNVVNGATVEDLRIDSATNLTSFIPGLKIDGNGRDQLRMGLRGAFASSNSPGTGQAVAMYVDGVYYSHTSDLGHTLFDVHQVEVLRGPQGTLYGQNVVGGLINIITEAPSDQFEAALAASYGSFGRVDLNGRISGPIAQNLDGSITFYRSSSDGWQKNLRTGHMLDALDTWGARGRLEWNPTSNLRVGLIADYASDETSGIPRNVLFGDPQRFTVPSDWKETYLVSEGGYDSHSYDIALTADYELGWATLSSITSYQNNRPRAIEQNFVTDPVSNQADTRANSTDTFTQELRLAGDVGHLRWQGGVFYYKDRASQTQFYDFFAAPGTRAGGVTGVADTSNQDFEVNSESQSVFAQGTYGFTDWLNLTLGGRYTWDQKDAVFHNYGGGTLIGGRVGPPFLVTNSQDSEQFTPRVTLDATFHDVGLFDSLLFFATGSRGYQSGDFTGGTTAATSLAIVPPETATNFEVGFKSTFADGHATLNATIFHVDYDNLQTLSISAANPTVQVASTDATAQGLEVNATWRPLPGLSLQADYAYLSTEIADGARAPSGVLVGGNQLPQSPRHSYGFIGRYETDIAPDTNLAFTVAYSEKTPVFFDVDNARTNIPSVLDLTRVQNLDTDISLRHGNMTFSVWAKNLLDTKSALRVYDGSRTFVLTAAERAAGENYLDGVLAPPLSFGATLRWEY